MSRGPIDPEKALMALGKFGKYQLRIWVIANLPSLYMAMQMLSMAFVNGKPRFQCALDDKQSTRSSAQRNNTCSIALDDADNSTLACGANGTRFEYDYNDFGNTIVTEWDLVCEKSFYSQFVGSIFMFGVMVGAMSITQMSDTFGRRWTFLICNWLYGVVGLASAFTNSYITFAFTRFLSGILTAGVGMVAFVISCEAIPTCWRAYSTLLGSVTWCIGYIALGIIAMFVKDWHLLSIILALPAFISLAYSCFLPETLRWLVVTGKDEEAERWIRTAAKFNGVNVCIDELRAKGDVDEQPKVKNSNVFYICKSKVLALQALVMCYLWLCNAFVYYGLSLFSTQLSGDKYINFILSGFVELPAYITAVFTLEKWGRRMTTMVFHIVAGIGLLILVFVPPQTGNGVNLLPLITTLSLIGKYAISCTFQAIFLFAAELYPTSVRTVGCGLSSTAARIGAILAPVVANMEGLSPSAPPAIFGTMSLLAALLTGCLPETKGIELPNDIKRVQPGPFQKLLCPQRKRSMDVVDSKDAMEIEPLTIR